MLRFAREADLPEMLEIYAPYVLNTTVSFEYAPPSPAEFRRRFTEYTKQFPWLVWEEGNRILGYAYASAPFTREAISGAPSRPSICAGRLRARTLPGSSTPCWRKSSFPRAIRCSTAWSAGKIYRPSAFTRKTATGSGRNFPGRALSWGAGWICYGWKNGRK